jgi:glycogen(starch) synthase
VVTICQGLRNDLISRGIPGDKIGTWCPTPWTSSTSSLSAGPDPELKARLGLAGCRIIGFLGSFYAYEGLDLLIERPAEDPGSGPGRARAAGGRRPPGSQPQGPGRKAWAWRTRWCSWAGCPIAEVSRYYDLVDLLAYPRHAMRLTELVTPLKPLEAMAQGHLLIASDVGGHKELIEDGATGFLFRAEDQADLARRALEALSLPDRGAAIRANGRGFVEEVRNWDNSIANYKAIYGKALGRPLSTEP